MSVQAGFACKAPVTWLDCTVDSDGDAGDFSLVLEILHACGHAHMRSQVPPGMDWNFILLQRIYKNC